MVRMTKVGIAMDSIMKDQSDRKITVTLYVQSSPRRTIANYHTN